MERFFLCFFFLPGCGGGWGGGVSMILRLFLSVSGKQTNSCALLLVSLVNALCSLFTYTGFVDA